MAERKFYLTTFSIQVVSDEPLGEVDLKEVAYEVDQGGSVGSSLEADEVEITPAEAAKRCRMFGSTPDFFQLDDEGKSLDEGDSDGG